jgi:hypothetical protein
MSARTLSKASLEEGHTTSALGPAASRAPALRAAVIMSWAIAGLAIIAALAGLFLDGLYHEGAWAREALRGGDLVTLIVAVPLLILSLTLSMRGSMRAVPVWIGLLAYSIYNYAFYAFGAAFNDAFVLHIALLSLSVYAMACALAAVDVRGVVEEFRGSRGARGVGLFLVIVGGLQAALWMFILVRNAVTGELIHDVPVAGQHLVFALDLALSMPALVLGGILLFRRRPFGFVLGTAMAVMGAVYQLNLMMAGVFQAHADVVGVKAFAPESVALTAAFAVASALLLIPGKDKEPSIV